MQTSGWDGNNWADGGTGNSWEEDGQCDGNKTTYARMVDGGNRNQGRDGSGTCGREQKATWLPVLVPYPSRLTFTASSPEKLKKYAGAVLLAVAVWVCRR